MKKIAFILAVMILLGLCACKAKDGYSAESAMPSQSESQNAEHESLPETEKEPMPSDDNSAQNETQKAPENTDPPTENKQETQSGTGVPSVKPKNADHISFNKDGIYYAHYFEGTLAASVKRKPTVYEDLDNDSFVKTDEWINVDYKKFTPADAFVTIATVKAQVYKMPDFARSDPYVYVIAAKPECEDEILIFSRLKEQQPGDTYGEYLKKLSHYYGYECTKAEHIKSIEIRDKNYSTVFASVTDAKQISDIYNKISDFEYTLPNSAGAAGATEQKHSDVYAVTLYFKDGFKITEYYTTGYCGFSGYQADKEFENTLLSLIPEKLRK